MNREKAVEVLNLSKHFGDVAAVDNINFDVKSGEIFRFLGPNGAGKTTTIRILTSVIKPDRGSAFIFDYDVAKQGLKSRQLMDIVPEMSNAYVDLSAWNNLMLVGGLYGVARRKGRKGGDASEKNLGYTREENSLLKGFRRE